MSSLRSGIETLRGVLEAYTGKTFLYAPIEGNVDYPIGTIQRISEESVVTPVKILDERGEKLVQLYKARLQVNFISQAEQGLGSADTRFLPREVLEKIATGYRGEEFLTLLTIKKKENGDLISILDTSSIEDRNYDESGLNFYYASCDLILNIQHEVNPTNVLPCIDLDTIKDLRIELDIKK